MGEKRENKKSLLGYNRVYFLYADRDCCLGFSISDVTFSELTSVWGVSAVAILDCSLNVYACGWQEALTVPAYIVAANCNNSQANPKHNYARVPAESTRCEAKMGQICTVQTNWLWCCASVTPIYIASTSLSAISYTLWRNTKWGLLQSGICRAVHKVTDLEKNPVQISKDEADEQQAHSMIPKIERYTDTLKQALTSQRQKV